MFLPCCLATGLGSLPYTEPDTGLELVWSCFPEAPFWPQLPARSPLENMYHQFCQGLPGVGTSGGKLRMDLPRVSPGELARFYEGAFASEEDGWQLEWERAAGYHRFLEHPGPRPPAVLKGQVTGPVSMGLSIMDYQDKPVLYDQASMELVCTQLRQLARGQEQALVRAGTRAWPGYGGGTLVFVDEPYLATYGSAFFTFGRDDVIRYINWVMEGIRGLKGVHCCGNTDWSILLATSMDVLSFDAFEYGDALLLYAREVAGFLKRGGYLSWGMVPSDGLRARQESVDSLTTRMLAAVGKLARHSCPPLYVLERSMVTPACGLGGQTAEDAEFIAGLTAGLSANLRRVMREESAI
ncbi:MAG: hypothetical protein AB1445_02715 [Bacillota bacterium]